ncbi:MAG TPA: hypothetical protein ENL02_00445 [Epsilonproteobacteria bacterium]|nr:hypothetical protein [Campylobacterota bacterium]
MVVMFASTILSANPNHYKRYDVKSGKIDYKIIGSGMIMGVETKTVGIKRVLFDAYGAREIAEVNKIQKTTMDGKTTADKSHKITYMNGAMIYHIDMKRKRIMRMQNPALMLSSLKGRTPEQFAEYLMKKMGGKRIGTEKILGYRCDLWDIMGAKQWIYKGVVLKTESNTLGMKSTEVAIKAKFDISLTDKNYKLPDFPVYDDKGEELDRNKLKEMDKKEESNGTRD